jgi:hypothetical protein
MIATSAMVICLKCNAQNVYGSSFCRACGFTLSANQDSGDRQPYSWQSAEFMPPGQTENIHSQKTQAFVQTSQMPMQPQVSQAAPLASSTYGQPQPLYHQSAQHFCFRCNTNVQPLYARKISTAGWIVFAVLLVTFFPLFWIGFLIKEDVRVCPVCANRVG